MTLPLYLLDQVTKWLVVQKIEFGSGFPVIPGFFDLVHVGNTGAAFGSFRDSNGFFIALSLGTLVVLTVLSVRGVFRSRISQLGVMLLASGILGNVTDRFHYGHVVDFLSFDLHLPYANPWPSFNVADSCICVAAICFLVGTYLEERAAKREPR